MAHKGRAAPRRNLEAWLDLHVAEADGTLIGPPVTAELTSQRRCLNVYVTCEIRSAAGSAYSVTIEVSGQDDLARADPHALDISCAIRLVRNLRDRWATIVELRGLPSMENEDKAELAGMVDLEGLLVSWFDRVEGDMAHEAITLPAASRCFQT